MTRAAPSAPSSLSPSALSPSPAGPSRVPPVTVSFWIIKVLTTGMGEAASDFLARQLGPVPAVALSGALFAGALAWQLLTPGFSAGRYWLAVVMVSVFGTVAADVVHVGLGVPYAASTAAFTLALAAVFTWWRRAEGTLDIHSVRTRRRELFYWAAVLTTFALGTAAGDLTAHGLGLGWWPSAALFAALIAGPALLRRLGLLGGVAAFWGAYIVTRPLGASVADGLAVAPGVGGLGLGTGQVALALGAVILAFVLIGGRMTPVTRRA